MRRQLKNYLVTIGNVDKLGDQPQFGTANVRAADARAAANQVDLNLGKRQYVSGVEFLSFVTAALLAADAATEVLQ